MTIIRSLAVLAFVISASNAMAQVGNTSDVCAEGAQATQAQRQQTQGLAKQEQDNSEAAARARAGK